MTKPGFQRLPTTSTWLPAIQREARLFYGVSATGRNHSLDCLVGPRLASSRNANANANGPVESGPIGDL
jgi:hypothetical protein